MVDKDEEDHQQTDEEGTLPGVSPDLVAELWSDRQFSFVFVVQHRDGLVDLVVLQVVVQTDFLLYFLLHTDQADLLVSLGLPLHPHHDVIASVRG